MPVITSSQRILISGLNVTATGYIYTNSASMDISSGWQNSKYNNCMIQIGAATLTKPIKFRIEGRYPGTNRAASINTGTISGNRIDKIIAVNTIKTPEVRVGVKVATLNASEYYRNVTKPHIVYAKLLLRDIT